MLYQDVLEIFEYIHRTRLFDEKWIVIQQWTSCDVAWLTGYSRTKFVVNVQKTGTVVLVLAQVSHALGRDWTKMCRRLTLSAVGRAILQKSSGTVRFPAAIPSQEGRRPIE